MGDILCPEAGASTVAKGLGKRKRKADHANGSTTGVASEEVTRAVEEAQTGWSTAEQAQKVAEDKLLAAEKMLVEERKNTDVLKATEDFKASTEYLIEKTLYFVGGFVQAKKAFQKRFPEADLQGIDPESPSEGETTTEAEQSGGEEDQNDAQS
ncbi:hypothetical protein RHMOL_Rhmol08G0123500 [Rhododendron molle]|uniref:Uncharacterized protein n=1 Tax=Rhododendron molle TaxID=49168 RepID=A0ACC0MMT7_RHOML|nr:hypothetical protein RHMOL_Rhmol08G0123500 [Rhododendron molle]